MNFLTSLRTLLLALVLSIGISYAYAAWTAPTQTPPLGNIDAPVNVGGGLQTKTGSFWSDSFVGSSADGYFGGNLQVAGNVQVPTLCLSGDCKSTWPVTSGAADWNTMINIPAGFVDGVDDVGATKNPASVYQCPAPSTGCSPLSGSTCAGGLSLNSTCVFGDSCGGRSPWRTYNCSFVGYLVQ